MEIPIISFHLFRGYLFQPTGRITLGVILRLTFRLDLTARFFAPVDYRTISVVSRRSIIVLVVGVINESNFYDEHRSKCTTARLGIRDNEILENAGPAGTVCTTTV